MHHKAGGTLTSSQPSVGFSTLKDGVEKGESFFKGEKGECVKGESYSFILAKFGARKAGVVSLWRFLEVRYYVLNKG